MEIYFNELKRKEVLDVNTGKNLGKIIDLVIESNSGKILKIIVPGRKGAFLSCENLEIKYKCITKIGDDVILVNLGGISPERHCESDCDCKNTPPCCDGDRFCDE